MNKDVDIQVSECLDGELDESRLPGFLERYGAEGGLRRRFSRYVVVRDCLRQAPPLTVDNDFAGRVMGALADEPVVLAPRGRSVFAGERARRLLRPAAGLAVAASVATVAVLGLRGDYVDESDREAPGVQSGQPLVAESPAPRSRSPEFQYADVQVRQPMAQTVSTRDRTWLNDYLLRHKEAAGFVGRSGFMPYVHIVATDAPARDSGESETDESLRRLPVNTQPE